ncbi:unnamed protein product [Cyberlindnera jadinii]|uniref:CID domain-containing protein n=1 Tax=Cyberlindnera jadinii (strain ATCC 18201 / CBS 1600 / BCRC 20928 / JCM 3617 / NBRC 0987 / NRRL Y-1542) TaxID=983966 RepID=A0A0H5C228_CYBJN|nr:unnamed protein product [Cyberlindnera jadinii]
MSYSEEKLLQKLDSLAETQDSIVSTSQWVLFYYRNADQIASRWEKCLMESPPSKILALVYLANDVVQQSRARKKTEFIDAFSTVLPNALSYAYGKVPESTQKRLQKIVRVLNERRVFPQPLKVKGIDVPEAAAKGDGESGSEGDKLKALTTVGSKFQRLYHELLLSANGSFTQTHLSELEQIQGSLKENIAIMQEIEANVSKDIEKIHQRSKIQLQKSAEIVKKQQELQELRKAEEQKRLDEEAERLERLKRQQEEDNLLPTYQDDSDSDSEEEKKESSSIAESDNETPVHSSKSSSTAGNSNESSTIDGDNTDQERPKKKLRFAD